MSFTGFTEDTYRFFMELGLNNDKRFMDANRERYRKSVREPLMALAEELLPAVQAVNPLVSTKLTTIVSRINRDTRYSKDKLPYRDHAWLAFRMPDSRISESFCIYAEIDTDGYGYGMGMWAGEPATMNALRAHIMADSARFLELANSDELAKYTLEGERFKRDRVPEAKDELKPYLNMKGMSWCYRDPHLKNTMCPGLADEIKAAIADMSGMYKFIMGL